MKHISENLIMQYVRNPEMLDEETRRRIETYLAESPVAETLANFYREFYDELDTLKDHKSPHIKAIIDKLFPSSEGADGEEEK